MLPIDYLLQPSKRQQGDDFHNLLLEKQYKAFSFVRKQSEKKKKNVSSRNAELPYQQD